MQLHVPVWSILSARPVILKGISCRELEMFLFALFTKTSSLELSLVEFDAHENNI
jgi:hypothetical protein